VRWTTMAVILGCALLVGFLSLRRKES
jgi:hypothetical protein